MVLAERLRGAIAPHHSAAARIFLAPLHEAQPRTPTILHAIGQHARLLQLQGAALTAQAAHVLVSPSSPLPSLWLHPEPSVVGALLDAHRSILCGEAASSAASLVLLQSILSSVRQLVGGLPSATKGAADASAAAPGPTPAAPFVTSADGASGAADGGGGIPPRSAVEACRMVQGYLSVLTLVLTETSHSSHVLSVASTLLVHSHPLRTSRVAHRPALAISVIVALLGVSHNRTVVLPPPPGQGTPVHASLCMLASQVSKACASHVPRMCIADEARGCLAVEAVLPAWSHNHPCSCVVCLAASRPATRAPIAGPCRHAAACCAARCPPCRNRRPRRRHRTACQRRQRRTLCRLVGV